MSELLVAAPLRIEAVLISSAARSAVVRKTGMGPDRAKAAAGDLAAHAGGAMLVLGFCGGLDATSVPGEVIVAEDVYAASDEGHAEERVSCDLTSQLVQRLTGRGMKVRTGHVVCVSKLALGERRAQLHAGGAIAVDMESVWLAAGTSGCVSAPPRARCARRLRCGGWPAPFTTGPPATKVAPWRSVSGKARAWAGTWRANGWPNARSFL
jgi:hypothetical protein